MNEKLGNAAYMTIGTKDLDLSFNVYEKLGYSIVNKGDAPVRWLEIADGSLKIILVEGKDEYIGLTYISDDINKSIDQLETMGLRPVQTAGEDSNPEQVIAQIREGILVSINQARPNIEFKFDGKTLMDIDYSHAKLEEFPNQKCGIFGEFALNIKDMDQAIAFWTKLGFKTGERFEEPYPWAIVTDDMFVIGLHQTDEFDQPAITYFAPNMTEKLKILIEQGLDVEVLDDGYSGKLKTPEGQQFFLFSLRS